jgi:hypothetical protein
MVQGNKQQSAVQKPVPFHVIKKHIWDLWWIIMFKFKAFMVHSTVVSFYFDSTFHFPKGKLLCPTNFLTDVGKRSLKKVFNIQGQQETRG